MESEGEVMTRRPGISTGQRTSREKLALARDLRRELTPGERRFWNVVRDGGIRGLKFKRQQVIDGFIADFFCNDLDLVVEIDGGVHETQKDYDQLRDQVISWRGLRVLRFTNQDVRDRLKWVLDQIKILPLSQRGIPLSERLRRGVRGEVGGSQRVRLESSKG